MLVAAPSAITGAATAPSASEPPAAAALRAAFSVFVVRSARRSPISTENRRRGHWADQLVGPRRGELALPRRCCLAQLRGPFLVHLVGNVEEGEFDPGAEQPPQVLSLPPRHNRVLGPLDGAHHPVGLFSLIEAGIGEQGRDPDVVDIDPRPACRGEGFGAASLEPGDPTGERRLERCLVGCELRPGESSSPTTRRG